MWQAGLHGVGGESPSVTGPADPLWGSFPFLSLWDISLSSLLLTPLMPWGLTNTMDLIVAWIVQGTSLFASSFFSSVQENVKGQQGL